MQWIKQRIRTNESKWNWKSSFFSINYLVMIWNSIENHTKVNKYKSYAFCNVI